MDMRTVKNLIEKIDKIVQAIGRSTSTERKYMLLDQAKVLVEILDPRDIPEAEREEFLKKCARWHGSGVDFKLYGIAVETEQATVARFV